LKASALGEFDKFLVKKYAFLFAIPAIAIFDGLVESVKSNKTSFFFFCVLFLFLVYLGHRLFDNSEEATIS
jgi:hypothetical protein